MDWTPIRLYRECESADKLRDQLVVSLDERLQRYYGTAYGYSQGEYWPENYYYTWVSYILPQIIFQNPRVRTGSGTLKGDESDMDAMTLGMAVNRWIKDTDYRVHLKRMCFDMGFLWGVSFVTPKPLGYTFGDRDDPFWRPQTQRINSRLYSMDPLADGEHDARFMQHVSLQDKDLLIEQAKKNPDEGWNVEAIEQLKTVRPEDLVLSKTKGVPDRGQVAWRTVWCPEVDDYLEKGDDPDEHNGTIYTLPIYGNIETDLGWLRRPYAFMGPRWGPYTIYGMHTVPNCPYPLGPLTASDAHLQELNAQALANYRAARNRKRLLLYDEAETITGEKITKAPDGSAVGVPGFDKAHSLEIELAGVTEQGLMQEEHARQMADRMLGINDVQRGGLNTGALATEVLEATAASNVRTSDMKEQFTACVRRELMTVAWYMWKFDKIVQPFTAEEQQQIKQQFPQQLAKLAQAKGVMPQQVTPKAWKGGHQQPFDSLELSIEPYSMQRVDEPMMQARAMQAIQVAFQVAQVAGPQSIRWQPLLEKLGDAMNWPDFGQIFNAEAAQNSSQPPAPGQNPPRLGGDVGVKPATPQATSATGRNGFAQLPSQMAKIAQ